jgi:transforming growth factor-beta-induced protein
MKNLTTRYTLLLAMLMAGLASTAQTTAPALADAADNGDGSYTNWFGTFAPEGSLAEDGWISHVEHGRLYIAARGEHLWLYDPNLVAAGAGIGGWAYTSREFFPYFLISADPATFVLFLSGLEGPAATPRAFLDITNFDKVYLPKTTTANIVEVAAGIDDFSSLVTAVGTAGLVDALSGDGPFTVFAPTNDAFDKLDAAALNDLLTNPDSLPALTDILTYHVVPGRITSDMLGLDVISLLKGAGASGFVQALNGSDIRVDVTPFGVLLNGSAMVTVPDVEVANGVIHIIDTVILPPKDIVDTAIEAGFDTLVTAVQTAGLEDVLRGDGPFTVFAPTEAAFAALPEGTIPALLDDPTTLANILTYHVVAGQVYSANVAPGPVPMVNGDSATISVGADGSLLIDNARIVATDIVTSNGVIHVIDAVILPPTE